MNTIRTLGLGIASAAAVTMFALTAFAQSGAPPAAPSATKAPAPVKAPAPPSSATKVDPKAKAEAAAKKVEVKKKTASVCVGLEQAACGANTTCQWIGASTRKDGRETKAYCKTNVAAAKKAAATAAAPAATGAPAKK